MELIKYNGDAFDDLIKNIDSPFEMMVWAGPKYKYPLTLDQLQERMNQTSNGKIKNHLFNLFDDAIKKIIGYIEIEILDEKTKKGSIQSVLIYKDYRGKKYSEQLLDLIISYSVHKLNLQTLELKVFSFNKAAISCYQKVGFVEDEILDHINPETGKAFQIIVMKRQK